jgi:hypothetical protein
MSTPPALINLGDLGAPATKLIEKVSEAVGGVFRPYQIVRVAKAEAEVEKIKAIAGIEVTEIQQRGLTRLIIEEGKKQENIESVTAQAIPLLEEDAKPEEIEDDWLANFFDKCKLISDQEMQSLWSKLLAGEANKAGTFSKRTVEHVSQLDRADAQLFTNFCSYTWKIGGTRPLIFTDDDPIYAERGLSFDKLTHLDNIGLIKFNNIQMLSIGPISEHGVVSYFGNWFVISFPKKQDNRLNIGRAALTRVGEELAPLCGAQAFDKFVDYVIEKWVSAGLAIWSKLPPTPDSA